MERQNNKNESWLSSFKNLRLRRYSSNVNDDANVVIRNQPNSSNDSTTNCSRTRHSFRKSFIKFHTRVKNAVSRNRSNRHTIHVVNSPNRGNSSSSNITNRVTLASPVRHTENIYSLEPVKEIITDNFIDCFPPPELPRRNNERREEREDNQVANINNAIRVPTDEISSLSNCYWYWGPLSRMEAEDRLRNMPDGAFLIRDSSSTSYLFTISFRSVGRTLHSRIEHTRGRYSLYDQEGFPTITELIENAMKISSDTIYCYSKSGDNNPNFPVRLTKPISRYTRVRSLKYLCRFVIKQCTNINDITKLPLPPLIMNYIQEDGPYF